MIRSALASVIDARSIIRISTSRGIRTFVALIPLALGGCIADLPTSPDATLARNIVAMSVATVSNTNDAGPGSLRQAIADASPGDVIDVTATGTITLASSLLIDKNLTVNGPASGTLVLSGAANKRVMQAGVFGAPTITVSLNNLTIADGGSATVLADRVAIGAGILNHATLTVTNVNFSNNHVIQKDNDPGTGDGGAIVNYGALTVTSSTFTGNTAKTALDGSEGGRGGAIANLGTLIVNNSTFHDNESNEGGAIAAINVYSTTIAGSTFTDNTVAGRGGAISVADGSSIALTTSSISGGSASSGGGIHNGGVAVVTRTLFNGNTGGGGIANDGSGTLTVANSTFTANGSTNTLGGAISNAAGRILLYNNTLAGNVAFQGGGVYTYGNGFGAGNQLVNNIVVSNSATNEGPDIHGDIGTGQVTTNNLLTSTAGGSNITHGVNGNIVSATPLIGALASNGGPTQTMALLSGSPAVNAGSAATCAASPVSGMDQRGTLRPSACDIGAFELSVDYTLSVGRVGSGTVTSNTGGINCGTSCSATYASGSVVELTAVPATGYSFQGWSGSGSGNPGVRTVTMTANASVTAVFVINTYALSVSRGTAGGGSITSSPSGIDCPANSCQFSFNYATSVNLTAVPSQGYEFVSWSGDGTDNEDGTRAVSMTTARSVTATFQLSVVRHQLIVFNDGNGTVTSSPAGIDCGATCSFDFVEGTSVTLSAVPASGYVLTGWAGDGTTNSSGQRVIVMSEANSTSPIYEVAPPPPLVGPVLTVDISGLGSGTVTSSPAGISCSSSGGTCSASFPIRTRVTLTATPDAGSTFDGWAGGAKGTASSVEIRLGSNIGVGASFGIAPWTTIDATGVVDGSGRATVGGNLSCAAPGSAELTATVTQQGKGKNAAQISGSANGFVVCGGRWSFLVTAAVSGAKFVRGAAEVTVTDGVLSRTQTVQLK